jgi:hypothetical protein
MASQFDGAPHEFQFFLSHFSLHRRAAPQATLGRVSVAVEYKESCILF